MARLSARRALTVAALGLVFAVNTSAQQRPLSQVVTGVVIDVTGAVLPSASVVLTASSAPARTTSTDASGVFRFDDVPQGRYEILVSFEGFRPTTTRLTVGSRAPAALRVTLPLANVTQGITVSNQAEELT